MNRTIRSTARTLKPPKPANDGLPVIKRFTVEEYHRMGEIGFLAEDDRCELLRGLIVEKAVINPAHRYALQQATLLLTEIIPKKYCIVSQGPVTLSDSEPEPDLAVWIGTAQDYRTRHARASEVVLLVEISDTSLATDRGEKLQLYAEAKIPVYWIVNLQDRIVEVYTLPRGGRNPTYRSRVDFAAGMAVPVSIAGKPLGTISVDEILP
jgi:Uma2 family endonuclease